MVLHKIGDQAVFSPWAELLAKMFAASMVHFRVADLVTPERATHGMRSNSVHTEMRILMF